MRRRTLALAAAAVSVAAALPAAAPAESPPYGVPELHGAAPAGPLENTGRWFTDARGRVVILHGINMVNKRPPYQPSAVGFGRDDARFLARNGFNTVRLGLIYGAVEPQPGSYDRAYIRDSRRTERRLAKPRHLHDGRLPPGPLQRALHRRGLARLGDARRRGARGAAERVPASYITSPGLNRAFDNFWANADGPGGVGLQDRYAAAWAEVAKVVRARTAACSATTC